MPSRRVTLETKAFSANIHADFASLGQVLDFLRLIWAVDHGVHRLSRRMEESLGVTGPQRVVIRIVGRFPGIVSGELARLLHVHPSTLTGILKRLERQHLIIRRPHARDHRRVVVALTAKGRALDVEVEGTVEAALQRALSELPRAKIRGAADALTKFAAVLDELAAQSDS